MIAVIVAQARNGVIGKAGGIPWRLPPDLKRFKALTTGHVLIMGRKTYESLGKPLLGRTLIVLTHGSSVRGRSEENLYDADSMESALAWCASAEPNKNVFICGGESVYREAFQRDIVDKVYLTGIQADYDGDTHFPRLDEWTPGFRKVSEDGPLTVAGFPHCFWFWEYERAR